MRKLLPWLAVGALAGGACGDAGEEGDARAAGAGPTATPAIAETTSTHRSTATTAATTTQPATTAATTTQPATTQPTTTLAGPSTTAAPPRSVAPPTGDAPARRPIRTIRTGGDSIALGMIPPLQAALTSSGYDFEAHWFIGFIFDDDTEQRWTGLLADPPDLLVLYLGTWEASALHELGTVDVTAPGWRVTYVRDFVAPRIAQLRETGIDVLWLGMPPVGDPVATARQQELNDIWSAIVEQEPTMTWLPTAPFIAAADGSYLEIDETADPPARLFQVDGAHLCPQGGRRIAEGVLDFLAERDGLVIEPGWAVGDWAYNPMAYGIDTCPAPSGP